MTTENESVAGKTNVDAPDSSDPSENGKTANAALAQAAADVRDDQDRRAAMWGSLLLTLLAGPVFLPTENERSLWRMTRHDSTGRFLLVIMFGVPVFLGIMGLVRGFRRSPPKGVLWVFSSVMTSLFTLAGVALMSMVLIYERRAMESPLIWLAAGSALLATMMFVRSFFRQRWQRFQHLLAAFGFLALMILLAIGGSEPNAFNRMGEGGWMFLFFATALVPFSGSTLFSRRAG